MHLGPLRNSLAWPLGGTLVRLVHVNREAIHVLPSPLQCLVVCLSSAAGIPFPCTPPPANSHVQCIRARPTTIHTGSSISVSLWKARLSYFDHPHYLRTPHTLVRSVGVGRVGARHLPVHLRLPQDDNCPFLRCTPRNLALQTRGHLADWYPASNARPRAGACKGWMTSSPEDELVLPETDRSAACVRN